MTVNTSSPTIVKVMRKPGDERSGVIKCLIFVFLLLSGRGTAGWALPKDSAVLEGEEGCTLALGCVICLVGDMMVVAAVVNSSQV